MTTISNLSNQKVWKPIENGEQALILPVTKPLNSISDNGEINRRAIASLASSDCGRQEDGEQNVGDDQDKHDGGNGTNVQGPTVGHYSFKYGGWNNKRNHEQVKVDGKQEMYKTLHDSNWWIFVFF